MCSSDLYRAGDAVNFSIGQGDTIVTPLQLARAYAALANGGTLFAPTVAKALVSPQGDVLRRITPKKVAHVDVPQKYLDFIDGALQGVTREGTMAWKMGGFPLEFPVMSLSEILLRPTAMLYRNLASMDVEESIRGQPMDGVILLTGCDKTTPALVMGAASCDLPTLVVSGGPMLNGRFSGELVEIGRAHV